MMLRSCRDCRAQFVTRTSQRLRCDRCRDRHNARKREVMSSRRWRTIRALILARDQHRCHYCGAEATTVDHMLRREHGGDERPDNLVACCHSCQYPSRRPRRRAWFLERGQDTGDVGSPGTELEFAL